MTASDKVRHIVLVLMIMTAPFIYSGAEIYAEDFASGEIPAVCRISSDVPESLDVDYKYTLSADDPDSPMPEGSEDGEKTVHMTDSGNIDFGMIEFSHPDVFYYTLMETTEGPSGFRRDRTKYRAALMADSRGHVTAVITEDTGAKTDKAVFRNSYRADKPEYGKTAPKTGDNGPLPWMMLMMLSCAGFAVMMKTKSIKLTKVEGKTDRYISPDIIRMMGAAAIISLFVMMPACQEDAYAQVGVTNDYSDMPVNSVALSMLDFDAAEFTSLDSRIQKGNFQFYQDGEALTVPTIYWVSSTAPKFGSSNATATADAKLGSNTIAGDIFTLRFREAATLSDGSTADVLLTFSDLYFGLSQNVNGTTGSKYYYPIIRSRPDGSCLYCNSSIGTSTKNSGRIKGVRAATRIKTTIKIVEPGSDEPVGDMYYILGFRDLDVVDNTSATGSGVDRYAKHYSEGIGLISGFDEPVYLSENTLIRQGTWDSVTKLRGSGTSDNGMESGVDIPVSTTGFSYYWYGSYSTPSSVQNPGGSMGTLFGDTPEVDVFASSGSGGTIEKAGERKYPVNMSASYAYTPSQGYRVKELIVDGEGVSFDKNGGTYVFDKLTETSEDGYDHTIEVTFHKPLDVRIAKNVKGPLGDRTKMFRFTVTLTGLETDEVFEITQDSTGTFSGMGGSGTKVSSRSFRPSSSGQAVLEINMKDDQFVRISSITGGAYYNVLEGASDHIASYYVFGSGAAPVISKASFACTERGRIRTENERIDPDDGMVTILFTNERGLSVPTGIKDRREPYTVAFAVFTAVAVFMTALFAAMRDRKRKCG